VITGLVSVLFLVIRLNSALFVLTLGFEVMFEASVRISCSVFTLVLVKEKSVYEVTLELYEEQSSLWLQTVCVLMLLCLFDDALCSLENGEKA